MAKKNFSLLNDLPGNNKPVPSTRRKSFDNALDGLNQEQVQQVTHDKSLVRGRRRKTIFLTDNILMEIEQIISQEGYSVMDFYEWLVSKGIEQYRQGVRPEFVTEITTKRIKTRI